MFCKHEWKVLSEVIQESLIEQAARLGVKVKSDSREDFQKTHISIITCTKCGKIKKFIIKE